MVLYDAILDGRAGHGRDELNVSENSECLGREISERVGEALVEFDMCSPNERTPMSFDERDYTRPGNGHVRPRSDCWGLSYPRPCVVPSLLVTALPPTCPNLLQ